MNRFNKVRDLASSIQETIEQLKDEADIVTSNIVETILVGRLEKENKELERQIIKCIDELNQLEEKNGRTQDIIIPKEIIDDGVECNMVSADCSRTLRKDSNSEMREVKYKRKNSRKEVEKADPNERVEDFPIDFGRLNMKVGRILQVEKHPDADTLYVEKVDIGGTQPITVVSGLVKYVNQSELQNRLVIILTNLKPAKMRGITSEGMVMCASSETLIEVLSPPPNSIPGDLIICEGQLSHPDPVINPKKKVFETLAPHLMIDNELYATYKGIRWTVPGKGFVTTATLRGVKIK